MAGKQEFNADAAFNESLQKRISGYERKAERAKKAWHSAQAGSKIAGSVDFVDIPEYKIQRKFDEETGKVSYEIGQSQRRIRTPHIEGIKRLKKRAYYEASGYIHKKISENEEDNTAVEAAHRLEQASEEAAANIKNALPSGRSVVRKVQQEMERKAQRAEKEYHYSMFQKEMAEQKLKQTSQTFKADAGKESGIVVQKQTNDFTKQSVKTGAKEVSKEAAKEAAKERAKRQSKRMMRKAAREAQKEAAKKSAEIAAAKTAEKTAETAAVSSAAAAGGTAANVAGLASGVEEYILIAIAIIVIIIILIVIALMVAFLIFTQSQFQENVIGAMYQAEPVEIEAAELHYSYMEASLREYMEKIDEHEPDYDGYVIEDGDSIGHNPYTLINYLSARYGEFTFNDVKDEIEDLFSTSYTLVKWVEDVEVEQEEDPEGEDEEEEEDDDDGEEEEEEPQIVTLHILHIKLTKTNLEGIVEARLDSEQTETYELYAETGGGLQYIRSPIGGNFYGNISSFYGYRYHPIYEEIRLHRGLDIAVPEGTDLYAGINGTVTVGNDPGGYGKYVIISGDDGTEVRYAHMSVVYVSTGDTVRTGDTFGQSGNTGASTGPHVHVEVKQDGEYYNPLFYLDNE